MPEFPKGVVWIASYPKSGNTWMRILLSNVAAGTDAPEDINRLSLEAGIASDRTLFESQTLVDSHLLHPREIEALRPSALDAWAAGRGEATLLKVHDAWTLLPGGTPALGSGARAVLYLVRDPRDVAVSFSFHQGRHIDRVIDRMNHTGSCFEATHSQLPQRAFDWSGHVESWLGQSALPLRMIRYEDLVADTAGVLRGALGFLGVSFASEAAEHDSISRAVRHAGFAELQRQEREKGFAERRPGQAAFFRQGWAGGWRSHLNEAQVRRIENAHRATMTRRGYLPAAHWESAA